MSFDQAETRLPEISPEISVRLGPARPNHKRENDMAQGRPTKWATAKIHEPVALGKSGIEVVVWDKWRKKRRGTAVISVGGIRWYPNGAPTYTRISWNKLSRLDGRKD